ncbi:glutamine synthetase [Anaeramoeba flamelloides]|uniref:Glutamine synthetase n=1 Tax=Anaeramoeba flamelloides TaxID=1746091 RepID=A0AAV7ZR55_9EUKA|nr:glutamine synthetase [Anaeramoeba flamelloides]
MLSNLINNNKPFNFLNRTFAGTINKTLINNNLISKNLKFKKSETSEIKKVFRQIKDNGIKQIDVRFMDFPGMWQHCSFPVLQVEEEAFEKGFGFDGSSLRGWKGISESDMLLVPDPSSAIIDPFAKYPTLIMIADIVDPVTKEYYDKDPRHIAKKAVNYLKSSGIGDTIYFGPELEFFIFGDVRYDQNSREGYYHIDSDEAIWNTGRKEKGGNKGYKIRHKQGYFPVPPTDTLQDIRTEMALIMESCGMSIEAHHHEVATAGQSELCIKYDNLVKMADKVLFYKYIVKNVAHRNGKTATFMPKPLFNDNGTGMHCHQSIWKDNKNLFAGNHYAGLSKEALWYIGGLLKHADSLVALTNPTTNSFKRLVPGFEAPIKLAYSARNRSASIRIPMYSEHENAKRIEFRTPDPTCNPYLAFSAMMLAGIDGIINKIDPGEPLDKDIYHLSSKEQSKIKNLPSSLEQSLHNLENDHDYLLRGNVFTEEVIQTWINYKMENEVRALQQRPHPYEFFLYYDV